MSRRLDGRVSEGFLLTRSEARQAVRRGRVQVDGQAVRDPAAQVAENAALLLDGRAPAYGAQVYIMLNKPAGYLSATEDTRDKTVLELLPEPLRRIGLGVCGRLDKDSEGLLLLTNDGELNHRLTSPRHGAEKIYQARLDGPATENDRAAFAQGVDLGDFTAAPALLEIDAGDGSLCRVSLSEGKFHQVKRMFAARGRRVVHLERLQMAGLPLDPSLGRGAWRPLKKAEIAGLQGAVGICTKNHGEF